MADNNELVYIRPRRGTETIMTHTAKSSLVLKEGEIFIEFPDTGIGKGPAKVKVGDGITPYAALDYVLGNESEYHSIQFLEEHSDFPQTLIDQIVSGVTLAVFAANTKRVMQLLLNKFNDYLPTSGGTINGNLTVTGDIKGKDVIVKTGTGSVGQTKLVTKTNQAENVTVTLPDQTGTIALLSDMPVISDNYSATSTDGMSGIAVNKALQTLDVTGASAVAASKTIKSWSETDGKVSITTQDISITKSQISDFPTIGNGTLTIQKNGTNVQTFTANQSGNVTANISVPTALSDLTTDASHRTVTDTEKTTWNNKSDLSLGETSSTAYRGDRGKTAYTHASDANKLTTATSVGLYKVGSTNQGHISGLTAIAKSDITGLGIPGADTYRSIKVNGTELLGPASSTGAINFKNGNNVSISGSGNDITISVPADTNTHRPIKVDGTQILGNNDTPVNFKKGSNITLTGNASTGDITIAATDTTYTGTGLISINSSNVISTTAEVNQNAFSNIKVGSTTVAAETTTDTLELAAGDYIKLTPDASNDKITIEGNYSAATTAAAGLMSANDKIKLNGIATGAEVNQNAFSNIKVGNTTVAAETKTDTVEFVGSNITITPDATNDKVTFAGLGLGTTSATAAAGNHTHTTTLTADSGASTISLTANTKYKLTAGGTNIIFTTPVDNNTTYSAGTNISIDSDNKISCTLSRKSAESGGTDQSIVTTGDMYYWNKKQETVEAGEYLYWTNEPGHPNTLNVINTTHYTYDFQNKWYSATFSDIPATHTSFDGATYYSVYARINPYVGAIKVKFLDSDEGAVLSKDYIGFTNGGKIKNPQAQNLYLHGSNEDHIFLRFGVIDDGSGGAWSLMPSLIDEHPGINLGNGINKWKAVYAESGTINTSDRNIKKDIVSLDDKSREFILALNPVSYKFIDGDSGRTHYGLIAQDVEDTMTKHNMTALDFAGFCKDQKYTIESTYKEFEDPETGLKETREVKRDVPIKGEYAYGLRYEEFIAPLIKTVQIQQKQIDDQQKEINELKEMVNKLLAK